MTEVITAFTARTQLGSIMQRVQQGNKRFIVEKRGLPKAVILSMDDYIRNFVPKSVVLEKANRTAKARGIQGLSMRQINAEIKAARNEKNKKH